MIAFTVDEDVIILFLFIAGHQDVVRRRTAFLLVLASLASLSLSRSHQSGDQPVSIQNVWFDNIIGSGGATLMFSFFSKTVITTLF